MSTVTGPAVIVGGGIGGLSAAIALRRAGIEALVLERAPELRELGAGIGLWPNATRVLRHWGLLDEALRRGRRMEVGDMRAADGRVLTRMRLPDDDCPFILIHRAELHALLAEALPHWAIHLGCDFRALRETADGVAARFGGCGEAEGAFLVGADGLWSGVRQAVLGDGPPVYRGYPVWRGVADEGAVEDDDLPLVETLGQGQRFGIVPIGGGRVAWWATVNEPEDASDGVEGSRAKLLRLFRGWHHPIPSLLEATPEERIVRNPTYDRPPVRAWGRGRITLLGDAAHPTTPNLGQGGCMAIEDGAVLARCLSEADDLEAGLRAYEAERYGRTTLITRMSLLTGRVGQWSGAGARLRDAFYRFSPPRTATRVLRRLTTYDATA